MFIVEWRHASVAEARAKKQVKTKVDRMILLPDNATDTSLFYLPVLANGADDFKLPLCHIYRGLEGTDARIVHTFYTMR